MPDLFVWSCSWPKRNTLGDLQHRAWIENIFLNVMFVFALQLGLRGPDHLTLSNSSIDSFEHYFGRMSWFLSDLLTVAWSINQGGL